MIEKSDILVIDGDGRHVQRFQDELTAAGHRIQHLSDCGMALSAMTDPLPAAVMLGVSTVEVSLLEDVQKLRHAMGIAPVVIYSDRFREVTRLRYVEAGADDFVPAEAACQTVGQLLSLLQVPEAKAAAQSGARSEPAREKSEMYFRLKGSELSNALQFLSMSSRTGEVVISLPAGEQGSLFIADNTIVHATFQGREGIDAVSRMLSVDELEARFFEGRTADKTTNDRSISQLLIEASVIADEMAAIEAETAG
jgi:ActR/RegA family two-component response regulator